MNMRNFIAGAGLLAGGVLLGASAVFFLAPAGDGPAGDGEPDILYWVAPMDPSYRRDQPGQSPMGMDLVPVYAGEEAGDAEEGVVRINPTVANNIGVRTAEVEQGALSRRVETVGYVRPVDDLTSVVDVRAEGWIERLPVAAVGDVVERGDLLFSMYAPAILTAQSEFLQARRLGREALIQSARARLIALGMTRGQIEAVARSGEPSRLVDVRAGQDGTVLEIGVREGQHVQPGNRLMTITDLSQVWVVADLFQDEVQAVAPGQEVSMRTPDQPGRVWEGEVEYVYPTINPDSRSVPVRMRFENPERTLRPNSYVNVAIEAAPRLDVIHIPREALIRTRQSDRVILALGEGRYRPARVVPGIETGGRVEIIEGLAPGERVVVSAQFLIDSEANLQGAMLRMTPPENMRETEEPAEPEAIQVTGIVESVMPDQGMIRLAHDPIPAIGWPEMVMGFDVAPAVDLGPVTPGDRVEFEMVETADGTWIITGIAPVGEDAVQGTGTVEAIMGDQGMIRLAHDPIPEIGWPAMNMSFELAEDLDPGRIDQGDRVEFEMVETPEGAWMITDITPVDGEAGNGGQR
ncbi:efflux RND transporter periplasmic adaptor subunit [Marinicauda sp. Alg238-R41]|uniref:efflux RND transporter periplasmic adaptor subunit n=1 Tax=Marinicauda sp. Alg238-R41 TaxID=2993447 RepID=UPI0022E6720C|nr:efflux RND transporter periplasmic adaptor subunit [Marinicauda sp. Alg238-R41]